MITNLRALALSIALLFCFLSPAQASAQQGAALRGVVVDPTGAVIPGAVISLSTGDRVQYTKSAPDGHYAFNSLAAGTYSASVSAKGFAPLTIPDVELAAGEAKDLKLSLAIAVEQEQVTVND